MIQIAASGRLSGRHIAPTFENTLKMAGTFRKWPLTALIRQAQNQFVEACPNAIHPGQTTKFIIPNVMQRSNYKVYQLVTN